MPKIFLSYRRSDTGGYAGRLADALERRFGKGSVFQDVEAIAPGSNFANAIAAAISRCQVLLVVIGDTWLTERAPDGSMRLDDPADFVRLEVASALRAATPVLPVLVEGAKMPAPNALPSDLRALARVQALELSDTRWEFDLERLAKAILALTGGGSPQKRRRALMLTGAVIIVAASGVAGYVIFNRPADVSGRWNLPNGSFWSIVQDGRRLKIDETHYESRQVWKRGSGTVENNRVEFVLDLVYGGPRRYEGAFTLSQDGRTLSGEVRDTQRGTRETLTLIRGS